MNDLKKKLSSFFLLSNEDDMEWEDSEADHFKTKENKSAENHKTSSNKKEPTQIYRKSGGENVVAINQKKTLQQKPQITIIEPRLYSEVEEVADHLLSNQSVIINFRRMDNEQATKMIDFLMGVIYAIKGDIQRLGEELFVCTPQSVEVNGSDLSDFKESLL